MKILVSISSAEFRYAMVNRPVGISCNPKDGFIRSEDRPARGKDHYDMARNGVAVYNRRLTDQETKSFEMSFMADGKEREALARLVIKAFGRYADRYKEEAEKYPDDFADTVNDKLKGSYTGFRPSVGDMDEFAKIVLKEMKS